MKKKSILFVCLGNICRSPTAHAVFERFVQDSAAKDNIFVDSCGTGDWHIGHAPDERAITAAESYNFPISHLRARQLSSDDFSKFDLILAMDKKNLKDIQQQCPSNYQGKIELFLNHLPGSDLDEVPDPYFGSEKDFISTLNLIINTSKHLLKNVIEDI